MSASVHYEPRFAKTQAEKLGQRITELCAYINAATAEFIQLIGEFDDNRYWEAEGFPSCVSWLNFHCGLGPGAAREHLRVAHALGSLPKISERFSDGRLTYSKVRAMTRVARPENEDFLLMVAKHGTAAHVERLVSQYRRVEKLRHPDIAQEMYLAREVTYHYDDDGCLVMKAKMPAEIGEIIVKALERAMDEQTVGARSRQAGPRLAGDEGVSAETSERLSCDCSKCTIEEDESGDPLNIGRKSRQIPPAMRRALWARDGGCRFPGCTNHKFVDGHHIKHWQDGGETSLDNLVLLCRFHHHLVHEGGFDCKKSKEAEIYFEDKREQRLKDIQESEPVSIEETLAWMYRKYADGDVSAETCKAKWHAGETMDTDYAVWVMANIRSDDS